MIKTEPESISQHKKKVIEKRRINQLRKKESSAAQKDRDPQGLLPEPKQVAILTNNKLINAY